MQRAAFVVVVLCSQLPHAIAEQPLKFSGSCMGTTYAVTIADRLDKSSLKETDNRVSDELERIEQVFSLYRSTSELSRLNEAPSGEWIGVSADLLAVTKQAIDLARETRGAFDPTVGPLVRLWRLHQVTTEWSPPNAAAIAEARKRVDFRLLQVRDEPPAIRKLAPGVELDLNALVEGYAIDQVMNLLQKSSIKNALIELGGEFRAMGYKPDGQPRKIGIENPLEPKLLYATASLSNAALATSGSYRQTMDHRGRRYGHILDARTGEPIEHDLIAVSVLASDAFTADGWATALMVLGPVEGLAAAEKKRLAAIFVVQVGRELQFKPTTAAADQITIVAKR